MGKWSRHPLGSDQALDIQDAFLEVLMRDEESDLYYFELELEEITKRLLALKVEDINKQISLEKSLNKNRFVIPYAYIEYKALSKDRDIRALLKDCLNYHALFSSRDVEELKHIKRLDNIYQKNNYGVYFYNVWKDWLLSMKKV